MTIPVLLLLLMTGVISLTVLTNKISVIDSAGTAARAAARGEQVPQLGSGTEVVAVVHDGDVVRVTVRRKVTSPIFAGFFVEQTAVAMVEPQAAAGP
ncbi:TadE family type IV pilus minor pilin [Dactylosporangium sp. NPDC000244]|uniref:TadE family type IV pilus minor pilin n=1 Tax=Dactylosporangium sp. NPDC000244 TaxID=3154365 RepID=UPI00333100EB